MFNSVPTTSIEVGVDVCRVVYVVRRVLFSNYFGIQPSLPVQEDGHRACRGHTAYIGSHWYEGLPSHIGAPTLGSAH